MQGYQLSFNVYAENEAEVADARAAIVDFIESHRLEGRAVTAKKIARAIRSLPNNPYVRSQINNYLKS